MAQANVDIQQILPHRYPMLLIDRVVALEAGKSCSAIKNITNNEAVVQGYAEGPARYPQMLMVESLAQTGAVALLSLPEFAGHIAFFGGIEKAAFSGWATPGDTLEIAVELTKLRQNAGVGEGTVSVDGQVICSATITFMVS